MQESWHVGLTKGLSAGMKSKCVENAGILEQDSLEIQYIPAFEHVDTRRAEEDGNGIQAGQYTACFVLVPQTKNQSFSPQELGAMLTSLYILVNSWLAQVCLKLVWQLVWQLVCWQHTSCMKCSDDMT